MKKAIMSYFKNFTNYNLKLDIKTYKKQNLVLGLVFLTIYFILFFIFQNIGFFTEPDNYFKWSESKQIKYDLNIEKIYGLTFFFVISLLHVLNLPIEIQRSNVTGKNWKKRILFILMCAMFYIIVASLLYYFERPNEMRLSSLIYVMSVFAFSGNNFPTKEEEEEK